ncbi:hypothetical protein N9Y92_02110 [Chlamydiales bacterium]|nr:hypothetical protein [Chlamydiales bacterium]
MKKISLILLSILTICSLNGEVNDCCKDISQVDFAPLYPFIQSKRLISLKDKMPPLKIKGDVRTDFLSRRERARDEDFRGGNAKDKQGVAIPQDQISFKMNLKAEYTCDDAWFVAQVEFDELGGMQQRLVSCEKSPEGMWGSGFCDYLALKRAYFGYEFWKKDKEKLIGEIGRRSLYYTFDSRIQFKARVDGIYLKYSNTFAEYKEERSSNAYITGALFLVNLFDKHYSYAAETGVYNVFDTGFDWKYSFVDWRLKGKNVCGVEDPLGWRFCNSQITCDYNFRKKFWDKKLALYGAFLVNHCASTVSFVLENNKLTTVQNPQKENLGWYLGFIIGEVKKKGDFSFDCNYQHVEAQAVPECDIRGIGRGNLRKESFTANRRGNSNFKGFHFELLYAITDKMSLDITLDTSRAIDNKIGFGIHHYSKFEVEFIHSF